MTTVTPNNDAGLSTLFDCDRDRLLDLLANVEYLCKKGSYLPAAKVFAEFRRLQEQHFVRADEVVAELKRHGACSDLLAHQLADTNDELRGLIEETWRSLTQNDERELTRSMAGLVEAVRAHEHGEKARLLPALCRCFHEPVERDRVVHTLVGL